MTTDYRTLPVGTRYRDTCGNVLTKLSAGTDHRTEPYMVTVLERPERRNGSRLTSDDHDRITTAAREYLTQCPHPISPDHITTARRLATHAIGCTADDLREVERDAITSHVLTIRNLIEANQP